MPIDDFDGYEDHNSFDENSYFDQEARRHENEELAAIDDCLDDEVYEGQYDEEVYDGEFSCLEDELDSVFADDEYWSTLDDEFADVDEPS